MLVGVLVFLSRVIIERMVRPFESSAHDIDMPMKLHMIADHMEHNTQCSVFPIVNSPTCGCACSTFAPTSHPPYFSIDPKSFVGGGKGGGGGKTQLCTNKGFPYLFGHGLEFVRVDKLPDFLHVVPILDNTVFNRILDLEQAAQFLGPLADKQVAFNCSCHDPGMLRASDAIVSYGSKGSMCACVCAESE